MSHHHHNEKKEFNVDSAYYLVGAGSGAFTGLVLEVGLVWVVVGALLGLLTAAFFVKVLTKGREV